MIHTGDALTILKTIEDKSVNCCVTSPPYYMLRDYGIENQIGLERTPDDYVRKLVDIFREVRRVLKDDGTLWLNLGDCYNGSGKASGMSLENMSDKQKSNLGSIGNVPTKIKQIKRKNLIGIPWRVAFALQADGWYLRQDIIWSKPNPMPESVKDRCTKSHEYVFLLSKSSKYYYDVDAIKEPCSEANIKDYNRRKTMNNKSNGEGTYETVRPDLCRAREAYMPKDYKKNRRSVWSITNTPYTEAHFATFPLELPRLCILAGCPEGGVVLDPFIGAGTTGVAATNIGRRYIGIELNPEYVRISERRIRKSTPLFCNMNNNQNRIEQNQLPLFAAV